MADGRDWFCWESIESILPRSSSVILAAGFMERNSLFYPTSKYQIA